MNTLQDLRHTLDQHASTVRGDLEAARVAAVRGRARKVRRQRAAGVGVAAVLAVAAATVVPMLAGGNQAPSPADRSVLGEVAPATFTSLGWTYRYADSTAAAGSRRVTDTLEPSELPRLVSWTTASGYQDVRVRIASDTPRFSEEGDFDDFVLLPPSFSGRVSVTGERPGVGLAVYEVDTDRPPDGVGEGALTFRRNVAGRELLGATFGDPGQASIEVDFTPQRRTLWLGYTCRTLPRDVRIHIGFTDEGGDVSFGACDSGSDFDPGGHAGTGISPDRHAGQPSTLRMWATRGGDPVDDGEIPGLRLGLGVYTPDHRPTRIAGIDMPDRIEYDGHVWEFSSGIQSKKHETALPPEQVPSDAQYVVVDAINARGTVRYALTFDGQNVAGDTTFSGGIVGASSGDPTPVPPGSMVSMRVVGGRDNVMRMGFVLYRRVG